MPKRGAGPITCWTVDRPRGRALDDGEPPRSPEIASQESDLAEYDPLGRLTLIRDADGGETTYTYDELGNRIAMTDAMGRVRGYEYDALGRMTAEVKPLGQRKTTTYDAVGQVTATRDYNGRVSTMSYDDRGRLIHATHGDGTETRYAYTVTGQLALVQDATGVTTFAYDDQDRLVEQVRPGGARLGYGYDAEGNRTRIETPSGVTTFGYDPVGRPSTILDAQGGVTTYGYDDAGNRTSLTQPNGVTTTYARDARDRLTTIESRTATNTLLARYAYTLDAAGNRTGVTEHGGRTVGWQYDALYRLVAETITEPGGSPETESFGYDAVGNRVFRATEAGVETSVYDDNDRLLEDGTATYTWDDQGNLRSKTAGAETTTYRWDGRDRLIEVSGPSTGLAQHVYDHAGDRVETRVDGVATKYLVDANRGLSQILEERSAGGSLVASYVHGDDGMVLARRDAADASTAYYLHDAQHSVRQLASGGGAITDAYSYSAFGETRTEAGATANRFRYGGQWSDARSGFYHLRARWMDPGAGRFASVDPFAGFPRATKSLHPYFYAGSNPTTSADPTGRADALLVQQAVTVAVLGTLTTIAVWNQLEFMRAVTEGRPIPPISVPDVNLPSREDVWGAWHTIAALLFKAERTDAEAIPRAVPLPNDRGGERRQEHHTIPIYLCGAVRQTTCQVSTSEHSAIHAGIAGIRLRLEESERDADRAFGRHRTPFVLSLAKTSRGRAMIATELGRFYSPRWLNVGVPPIGTVFPSEASAYVSGKTSLPECVRRPRR